MIKTKLFVHTISPAEETPIKVDEQINDWVEETNNEILSASMSSNVTDINGKEIVRVLVRYREDSDLVEEEDSESEISGEPHKRDDFNYTGGYADDI